VILRGFVSKFGQVTQTNKVVMEVWNVKSII